MAPSMPHLQSFCCVLALLATLATTACTTTTMPLAEADPLLAEGEARVAASDWEGALDALDEIDGDKCPMRLRDRRDLALARARFAIGEYLDAYNGLKPFADDYPLSELRPEATAMLWDVAEALRRRDSGFLFFWSDRTGARTVLEHLVARHPESPRIGDALKILGDMAYDDGNFELAQQRYRDLLLDHPDEWTAYARFRYAMSIVASLEGPEYDQARMAEAERELRQYLAGKFENPTMNEVAEATTRSLVEWQLERELGIAAFYARIGNAAGELLHLERAADARFAGAPRHAEATAQLAGANARKAAGSGKP
ncbi:MAG: outer membrane protein assembly factor BamD [Planctomycetes bacterium]|nr:outer membrane protein assembly factor BamD [Planctomycetota bacterium]